ncbi:uncharacterized protein LOC123265958 isoform X2 [Cotesia glomerata]|uniref:uncharacterized protein LOC123265958 isoform X2 n=1 Tax=Cotesia glomerata TaxID=32391 RepID=UPI001D0348FC|nr:uncharacterized protein LOC123265958 isoform X2 [Cotesia glomerata]
MIFKSYLLLISYFVLQNLATGMNLHDLSSIEIFISNVRERAWSYYQVENAIIKGDEKEDILKVIFYDLRKILTEFNNMSADSRNVLSSGGLVSFISTLEKFDRKNGSFLSSKLSDKLTKIFNISETINSYVEPLLQLGTNNISDIEDVLKFCPTDANAGQNDQFKYEKQIILKEYREFVEKLTTEIKDDKRFNVCGQTPSLNQAVFNYYHQVVATYLKEYVMLYYTDIIDARCFNLKSGPLLMIRHNESLSELTDSIKLTKVLLNRTNHYMHRCDADHHKISYNQDSYLELNMIQSIIIEEKDMSTDGYCSHNCDLNNIKTTINHRDCHEFRDCHYIGSTIDYCEPNKGTAYPRFNWFKSGDVTYGDDHLQCNGSLKRVSSYFNLLRRGSCDYCVCSCVKESDDDSAVAAISFREQITDIHANEVVVGVRFVKKGSLIHVQIKEGQLKPYGIRKTSWKPLETFIRYGKCRRFSVMNSNSVMRQMTKGVDYGEAKFVSFDDMIAPEGFVVTGVRFGVSRNRFNKARDMVDTIQLEIRVSPYDYVKGVVYEDLTHWVIPDQSIWRQEFILINPDNPTKSTVNYVDSTPIKFVRLQASDLLKDAGQSTVPFFDAQDVEGKPEFPLGGVGLVHRGREGYGGFLAFKIYDLNLSKYFH